MEDTSASDDMTSLEHLIQEDEYQNDRTKIPNSSFKSESEVLEEDVDNIRDMIGTNKTLCVICTYRKIYIRSKAMHCFLATSTSKMVLIGYAERLNDHALINRLKSNAKIWLHAPCWTEYGKKSLENTRCHNNDKENSTDNEMHIARGLYQVAYFAVCDFIETEILNKDQSISLNNLRLQYKTILYSLNEQASIYLDKYKYFNLGHQIMYDFGSKLDTEKCKTTDQVMLYRKGLDLASAPSVSTHITWTYRQIKQAMLADDRLPSS